MVTTLALPKLQTWYGKVQVVRPSMITNALNADMSLQMPFNSLIMDRIVKSRILLFLIALFIPSIVFLIMAYMMSMLLKGSAGLSIYICVATITYLLIASAEQINEDVDSALATTIGILIGAAVLFFFLFTDEYGYKVEFGEKERTIILLIYGWSLSVFMWT